MDQFGFEQLAAWMAHRVSLPVGPLFCVIDGPTRGRRWAATAARCELRQLHDDVRGFGLVDTELEVGADAFLSKPFTKATLLRLRR